MPHPGQRAVRRGRKRFTWLSAGRRWRKTTLFAALSLEAHITGETVIWGAPTYDQVFNVWQEMRRAAGSAMLFNQSRMTATLGAGAIMFRSLDDPDNARGWTANGVVIDECADVAEHAWSEVLRPMLIDTNGWLLAGGTPKGRNWFWRECMAAANGERPESAFFQAPTLGAVILDGEIKRAPHPLENPDIPFAEIQSLYRSMSERSFRQEILAEFIEDGGEVFRNVRAAVAEPPAQAADRRYVFGVDWGRDHDYTVVAVMDVEARALVAADRYTNLPTEQQINRVVALYERYRPEVVVAERNSLGAPLIDLLFYQHGLPVQPFATTHQSKARIIDALSLAFERRAVHILDLPWLVGELEAYAILKTTALQLPTYGALAGMHDDGVMALALAWSGVLWATGGDV